MAEEGKREIPFKILVETLAAEKSVGELKQEFTSLNEQIGTLTAGTEEYNKVATRLVAVDNVLQGVKENVEGVVVATKTATSSILPLQREFKELQRIIQTGKDASGKILNDKELEDTKIKLGEIGGRIRDIKEQALALDPEKRFAAFAKIGGVIANGFAAAQAATALFGEQNEELTKTLVKVQAATALAQGIQGLAGFQKALVNAGLAMKAFALSNPFTAILVGITAVTVAVVAMTKAFGESAKELERLKQEAEDLEKVAEATDKFWQARLKLLQAQGASAEKIGAFLHEMYRQQIEDVDNAIKVQQALVDKGDQDAIKKLSELQDKRKTILLNAQVDEIKITEDTAKQSHENRLKLLESEKIALENAGKSSAKKQIEIEKEKRDAILNDDKKSKEEKLLAEAQYQSAVLKIQNDSSKTVQERNQKYQEEELKLLEAHKLRLQATGKSSAAVEIEIENKKLEFIKNSSKSTKADIELAEANHAIALEQIYQKQVDDAVKAAEAIVAAEQKKFDDTKKFHEQQQQLAAENLITEAELTEDPVEIENAQYQQRLLNQQIYYEQFKIGDQTFTRETEASRKQRELLEKQHQKNLDNITINAARQRAQLTLQVASQGLGALAQLTLGFAGRNEAAQRRAFNVSKAFNIAQATIDTYASAQAVFFNSVRNPLTGAFPFIAYAQAAAAILSGLARVAAISRTQFNATGGGAPDTGGGLSGGGSTPSFSGSSENLPTPTPLKAPQLSSTTLDTDEEGNFKGFGKGGQEKEKDIRLNVTAVVVESEMTKTQKIVRGIEERAEF